MSDLVLTKGQNSAFRAFKNFIKDNNSKVFILKGYAGTGKTTLMKIFIEEMEKQNINYRLLASTGRAAKILANFTNIPAKTVHGEIYTFTDLNQNLEKMIEDINATSVDATGQLFLNFILSNYDVDNYEEIYYIVDEASMIADCPDKNVSQAVFGSGKLLADLFAFNPKGKFIFVGDVCQLPPITQPFSPALSAYYIENKYNYNCVESELTEVVRQSDNIDIVQSAHLMRKLYSNPQPYKWAKFPMRGYNNIHLLSSQTSLIKDYIAKVKSNGFNDATLICFSNRQSAITTELLRPAFGHMTNHLEVGDLLLVTQNNLISGLMNGDLCVVESIGEKEYRGGLHFIYISVKELFTQKVYSQLMIEEVLYGNQTNITQQQQKNLFINFYYRMNDKGIKQKSREFKDNLMKDPYLNALRVVYGYALTCHKAQGGEWNNVFLDIPRSVPALEKPYVYQWVYTAMTRAKQNLYLVDDFWIQ